VPAPAQQYRAGIIEIPTKSKYRLSSTDRCRQNCILHEETNYEYQSNNCHSGSCPEHASSDHAPSTSISGFNSALTSIRFFDEPAFQARTAPSVTIYASSVNQTVLTPGSYTLVGTYTLATSASDLYTTATSPADTSSNGNGTISYDTVSGLNIAAGTKSILFQFGLNPNGSGGGNFGNAFSEIQAFNTPVPETSSSIGLGLMLALSGLVVIARKRSVKA